MTWGENYLEIERKYPDFTFTKFEFPTDSLKDKDNESLKWFKYSGPIVTEGSTNIIEAEAYYIFYNDQFVLEYFILTPGRNQILQCDFLSDYCNLSSNLRELHNMTQSDRNPVSNEQSPHEVLLEYYQGMNDFARFDNEYRNLKSSYDSLKDSNKDKVYLYAVKTQRDLYLYNAQNLIDLNKVSFSESSSIFEPEKVHHSLTLINGRPHHILAYYSGMISPAIVLDFTQTIFKDK